MRNLHDYDWVIINTSAGKDSQAMMHEVVELAKKQDYPLRQLIATHCCLGRVEWQGTKVLAAKQAAFYGIPFYIVRREQDLLDHILARGMFPSPKIRWCTSDHKRAQVYKLMTELAARTRKATGKRARILNCIGIRAEESDARAKKLPFKHDAKASNGRRHVDLWYPIFYWHLQQVWDTIHESGCPYHEAYDLGMKRLSCVFCIFAPRNALLLAGEHNPELLEEYVQVEKEIGHSFRVGLPIVEIQKALKNGERGDACCDEDWRM